MISIEFFKSHFGRRESNQCFIRSFNSTKNKHSFWSIFYFTNPSVDDVRKVRRSISLASFESVIAVIQLDRSSEDWRSVRREINRLKNYISVEFVYLFDQVDMDFKQIIDIALEETQMKNLHILDTCQYIQIECNDYKTMYENLRNPERLTVLMHIPYYKRSKMDATSLDYLFQFQRDLQHLNFIKFLEDTQSVEFNFENKSVLEIGPAAGFFYRYAQGKGASSVIVAEKNAGFCTLAEVDRVQKVLEVDITNLGFCEVINSNVPDGVSYFFAKGVLNVYHFRDIEQYKATIDAVTKKINELGIWVTYNVDRKGGPSSKKIRCSENCFESAGWKKVHVPTEFIQLTGLNYLEEVDWSVWMFR